MILETGEFFSEIVANNPEWEHVGRLAAELHRRGWIVGEQCEIDSFQYVYLRAPSNNRILAYGAFTAKILLASCGLTVMSSSKTNWIEITDTSICSRYPPSKVPVKYIQSMQDIFDAADKIGGVYLCGVASRRFADWYIKTFDGVFEYDDRFSEIYPIILCRKSGDANDAD